jgi:hypothetical protein
MFAGHGRCHAKAARRRRKAALIDSGDENGKAGKTIHASLYLHIIECMELSANYLSQERDLPFFPRP